METFHGKAHLPGADKEWELQLEIDWDTKEVNVHIDEAPNGITDWPGLIVNTFGPMDEIAFRTKGIPTMFTHWWHFVRGSQDDLWGIILGVPGIAGRWATCMVSLEKTR